MVTLDKIRLTGLLTKSPAQSGLFYAPATRFAVTLPSRQPLGGLSEPLGPGARPAPEGCAGNVPNRPRTVPALLDVLKSSIRGFVKTVPFRVRSCQSMALRETYRRRLREQALGQYGYVTTQDADELGVPAVELRKLHQRGGLERISHGLYRFEDVPPTPNDEFMEAVLRVGKDAVLAGDAVLALHDLGRAHPRCIRVATARRVRRQLPPFITVQQREVPRAAQTTYDGIPSMTVAEAIRDCRGRLMPERLVEATLEAAHAGLIRTAEADRLIEELEENAATLPKKPRTSSAGPPESALEPGLEDFVRWFADWWLRRGRDLVRERKKRERLEAGVTLPEVPEREVLDGPESVTAVNADGAEIDGRGWRWGISEAGARVDLVVQVTGQAEAEGRAETRGAIETRGRSVVDELIEEEESLPRRVTILTEGQRETVPR
jgi:hypothetical protein